MTTESDAISNADIPLDEMIETLRQQLESAQLRGANRPIAFGVEKVELELKVAVSRGGKGQAGVKFWVVNAGGTVEGKRESVHTFKLTLLPLDAETRKRLDVASKSNKALNEED